MGNNSFYEQEARMVGLTTAKLTWALGREGEYRIHKIAAANVFNNAAHMECVLAPFRVTNAPYYDVYLSNNIAWEQAKYYQNKSFSELVDDLDTVDLLIIKDQLLMPTYESLSLEDGGFEWDYNDKLYCIALAIRTIERELKDRTTPTVLRTYGETDPTGDPLDTMQRCYAKEVISEAKEIEEGIIVYPVVETAAEMKRIRNMERESHKQEEKILAQMLTKFSTN